MKTNTITSVNRREFLKTSALGIACLPALDYDSLFGFAAPRTKVAIVKTTDRTQGVVTALRLIDFAPMAGKKVMLKPNFNTADIAPGSTHNDTLAQLIRELRERGASKITIGERSGPTKTQEVMAEKGIFRLAKYLNCDVINYENLHESDWVHVSPPGNHWDNGFFLPRSVVDAEYFVSTCCLKTHGFGGHYTMSMKLAVGLTPKKLMSELHGKRETHMRAMIAEINQGYKPDLIVLDGVDAFVDGGPSRGELKRAEIFIAGTDRVGVDAVGVAVLKLLGSNETIMNSRIFEQDQIKRAVEVGLGITGPEQIQLVTADAPGRSYAEKLKNILADG